MKKHLLFIFLTIALLFPDLIFATPSPTTSESTTSANTSIEALRNKLAEKIKANKGKTSHTIGILKSLDQKSLVLESQDQKRRNFEYDEAITVLSGAAKQMPYFEIGSLLTINSEASSPNLALEITSHAVYDFIVGEVVNIDIEKKQITIVSDISKQEIDISTEKINSLLTPEAKTSELKKTTLAKMRVSDKISFPILSKSKKDKILTPNRIIVIPSELIEFSQ